MKYNKSIDQSINHTYTKNQLLELNKEDREKVFMKYLRQTTHIRNKQNFLFSWITPNKKDIILECGSSSGKTCIDLAKRGGCHTLGIDFDPSAVKIATKMRNKYFPALKKKCIFKKDDLTKMKFNQNTTKIIMSDFTEHLADSVLNKILHNIKKQLPTVLLYIHTPLRTHIFEIMRRNNFILKKLKEHINVKTEKELKEFLESRGWKIIETKRQPSHVPILRWVELLFGYLPIIGELFHRKIAVKATSK